MDLGQGLKIIEAGLAKAPDVSADVAITVVDRSGDVVAQARMEGAIRFTTEISRGKAIVSAVYQMPSNGLPGDDVVSKRLNELNNGQLIFEQGGVPVFVDGALVGGVGVSGSTGEIDEQVATAAAAAVA